METISKVRHDKKHYKEGLINLLGWAINILVGLYVVNIKLFSYKAKFCSSNEVYTVFPP